MLALRLLSRPSVKRAGPWHRCSSHIVKSKFTSKDLDAKDYECSVPKTVLKNFMSENFRDKVALMDGFTKETATYAQLYQRTYSCAWSLKDRFGVQKGACVGILSPNHINFFTAFHGVGLTGGCSTTINPMYVEDEIEHQLKTTNAMMLIVHPLCLEKGLAVGKKLDIPVLTLGEETSDVQSFNDLLREPVEKTKPATLGADGNLDSLMTIPFSSGTTGLAKVCRNNTSICEELLSNNIISYLGCHANSPQLDFKLPPVYGVGGAVYGRQPNYHSASLLSCLWNGHGHVHASDGRCQSCFDAVI